MKIGELFAGYGGLGMGVRAALGGEVAWVSDVCKFDKHGHAVGHHTPCRAPCSILAHRLPGVPNHGDITKVDWSQVEPVVVLTGGFPCTDVSPAGKRAGLRPGTRSGLWTHMAYAIDQLRPALVVVENVRGLLSAEAHSDMEPCPWCVGDDTDGALRALGAVLGDLADLGYDAAWHGLRAADVGAPHGRFRVFVVAWPAANAGREHGERWPDALAGIARPWGPTDKPERPAETAAEPAHVGHERGWRAWDGWAGPADGGLLPTPRATDGTKGGPNQHGSSGDLMLPSAVQYLLPTPNPFHAGNTETPEEWRARRLDVFKRTGTRHGPALNVVVQSVAEGAPLDPDHYMPDEDDEGEQLCKPARPAEMKTRPSASTASGLPRQSKRLRPPSPVVSADLPTSTGGSPKSSRLNTLDWGKYADAIARWEALTRPAPPLTEMGPKGSPRLSPRFSEWMMGLPAGWVTDVPGITRNEALKALGNGVVPAQAAEALRILLPHVGAMVA